MATILVIDDEPPLLNVIARRLKLEGYEAIPYPDAGPALAEVDFETIDLVVTDLVMPTSGEQAIQTIREQGFDMPIIVLSGHLKTGDEERLIAIGANHVLSKPFKLMGLLTVVEQLLSEK